MSAPANAYIRIIAAALKVAQVPGAKTIDPIMAMLALAAAIVEDTGGSKAGFVKAAEMAYDWGRDHVPAVLADSN